MRVISHFYLQSHPDWLLATPSSMTPYVSRLYPMTTLLDSEMKHSDDNILSGMRTTFVQQLLIQYPFAPGCSTRPHQRLVWFHLTGLI